MLFYCIFKLFVIKLNNSDKGEILCSVSEPVMKRSGI